MPSNINTASYTSTSLAGSTRCVSGSAAHPVLTLETLSERAVENLAAEAGYHGDRATQIDCARAVEWIQRGRRGVGRSAALRIVAVLTAAVNQ